MSSRILLCVDGSTYSRAAARVAIQLAAAQDQAHVTALHVVPVVTASGNLLKDIPGRLGFEPAVVAPEVYETHVRSGEDLLAEVAREAEQAGVELKTVNQAGAIAPTVAHFARHVDLVVMGLRGTTEDQFPGQGGGHIDQILDRMLVPVLFVSKDQKTITGAALGYDGSDGAARALKATALVAGPIGLPVHAIYVSSDGTGGEILDECGELFPDLNIHKHVVTSDEPHTAMASKAVEEGANMLVVGFRGRSKVKDFLYGTAAQYILMKTDLMVLVAH